MSSIDEIKTRLDIVDLVSETVTLRRSGKNHTGFCPFHSNTRTPAFVVFPDTGTWRCFGHCNEGGDIFKFVMKRDGWDFSEALRNLAERAGVQLRPHTPQEQAKDDENDRLRTLLEAAVTFFRHQLSNTPAGKTTLDYLHTRGLNDETIEAFGIGYAPDNYEALIKHFSSKGFTLEDLSAVGLVSERDSGGHFDKFRHRVMIPIRDQRGRMAGFGARALKSDERAKYLNSPQTVLFNKSSLLYGLDRARKSIRAEDQVVIVEGYMDVIALHQAGFTNVVSPMGTALTEQQLRVLKRLTRRIVLALDADAAGTRATLRGLQIARETMDRQSDPSFDARGLLKHEARLQADIRVTTLPEEKDPDDVIREDPSQWPLILEAARPIVVHVMETLVEGHDLNNPKEKTEIASQVLPLIQDVPSAIERDTYIQRLARLLRVDERALLSELPKPTKRTRRRRTAESAPTTSSSEGKTKHQVSILQNNFKQLEAHSLGIIMRHPELLYRVDRALQEAGLERISSQDFQLTDHQVMFRVSLESLEQDYLEPLNFALDNLPLPIIDIADEILVKSEQLDPNEEKVLEDLLRAILTMRLKNLKQYGEQLRFLQEEAQEKGDLKASQYQQPILKYNSATFLLNKASEKYTNRSLSKS
ncbi:MAG: DNA primase [Chloroflexi bacterium]|nr:DNA primase [Chloroflexota bacterium]